MGWKGLAAVLVLAAGAGSARAEITDASAVTAWMRPLQSTVAAGQPVWVEFLLHNPTREVAVLVNGAPLDEPSEPADMGLPPGHVLGPLGSPALSIRASDGGGLPRT